MTQGLRCTKSSLTNCPNIFQSEYRKIPVWKSSGTNIRETKNQENSIGLRLGYSSSANFHPPRAGKISSVGKRRIC